MAKIGIDFGTTYTTVSQFNPKTGKAEAIRIQDADKLPSMLHFSADCDKPLVGQEAYKILELCRGLNDETKVFERLSGIVCNLKKDMTPSGTVYVPGDKEFSYAQLIGMFFTDIKKEVEDSCFQGQSVTDVCITYPAKFDVFKTDILRKAANLAGFNNVKLLKEPIAAALGYDSENSEDKGVLVYDFGGGTFDVAYVKFDGTGDYLTLPADGDSSCGGETIDQLLYDEWDKLVYNKTQKHIAPKGQIDLPFLKYECKRQKEFLSAYFRNRDRYDLEANIGGQFYTMPMTKTYWENLISPVIDTTIGITQRMIERIKSEKLPLNRVLLIGGSSRLPLVRERLTEISPVEPHPIPESDLAVSLGAAFFINRKGIKKWCRHCGLEIDSSVKFCKRCGTNNCRYDFRFDALV